jgi:hypothetical protein
MKPSNLLYKKNDLFPGLFPSKGANLKQGLTLNDKSERRAKFAINLSSQWKGFLFCISPYMIRVSNKNPLFISYYKGNEFRINV